MCKWWLSLIVGGGLAVGASGADWQATEVFAGYSAKHSDRWCSPGFNGAVAVRIADRWRIATDFSWNAVPGMRYVLDLGGLSPVPVPIVRGETGLVSTAVFALPLAESPSSNQMIFLFGPQYTVVRRGRINVHVHTEAGLAHQPASGTSLLGISITPLGSPAQDYFATALGGALDFRLSRHLSVRAFQPDLVLVRRGNAFQREARISTGLVLH